MERSESSIEHIRIYKFYPTVRRHDEGRTFLSDCCILKNLYHETDDSLILLESELSALQMALHSADSISSLNSQISANLEDSKTIDVNDITINKPLDGEKEMKEVKRNLEGLKAKMRAPPHDFTLSNIHSLQ